MRRMSCAAASENIITLRTLADADMVVTAETPLVRIWACTACVGAVIDVATWCRRRVGWKSVASQLPESVKQSEAR